MNYWEDIVNTAMLGTDKKGQGALSLPPALAAAEKIVLADPAADREVHFLNIAALAYNFRQCGVLPVKNEQNGLPVAPAEDRSYCTRHAMQVLSDILAEQSAPLAFYWLQHCKGNNKIVSPEFVPVLLTLGIQHKKWQPLINHCCGKRGEWLGRLNPAWTYTSTATPEEIWETGTPDQRKIILKEIRAQDPARARAMLQQTWSTEDAATRTALLELMATGISSEDLPFLETLNTEKSKKVKDAALELLKMIPGSELVLRYEEALRQIISLKKEKALLGLSTKLLLDLRFPVTLPEALFKTGIDKLSNSKEITDDEYILSQLVASVPPAFWETHFDTTPDKVLSIFNNHSTGKKMIPALVNAINRFNDTRWALLFMQHNPVFYIDIIPLLPADRQQQYSMKFFDQFPDRIIQFALQREEEWDLGFTEFVIAHAAKFPYQYNRSFFLQQIHLIPVAIEKVMDQYTSNDSLEGMWESTRNHIRSLTALKNRVQQSFSE